MSGWDESGRWRWGKAGQRLDPDEAARRERARAAARNRSRIRREADDARAQRLYLGGHLAPWRITLCLDEKGLHGPEADEQCGAAEPDVDLWEAGVLYPTWEQVVALARLCGVTPRFLMDDVRDPHRIRWDATTLRFHLPASSEYQLVERFTPEAIRDRLRPLQPHGGPPPADRGAPAAPIF